MNVCFNCAIGCPVEWTPSQYKTTALIGKGPVVWQGDFLRRGTGCIIINTHHQKDTETLAAGDVCALKSDSTVIHYINV